MIAQPYLRVSTDDKGQDPTRQLLILQPWGQTYNVPLLPPIIDEGTSAYKTNPFERPAFLQAIRDAKAAKATAIIVEQPDRFTRRGTRLYAYYKTKLDLEYGLKLWCADRSMENQDSNIGELMEGVQAFAGREKSETLSRRVKEGMARARAKGVRIGQPPKPLTPPELDLAAKLRETRHPRKDGSISLRRLGWDAIAQKLNELRGATSIVTPDVRRRRSISGATVRRAFKGRTDWKPAPTFTQAQPRVEEQNQTPNVVKMDDTKPQPFHDYFLISEASA